MWAVCIHFAFDFCVCDGADITPSKIYRWSGFSLSAYPGFEISSIAVVVESLFHFGIV